MSKALARGSTAQTTLTFIRATYGDETADTILGRLGSAERKQLQSAGTTDYLSYDRLLALWKAADAHLAPEHPRWMEAAGAYAIESLGQQMYGGLLHKASPTEFVTQSVSLFNLYYPQGNMEAVEVEPGRAVIRLVGFDALGPLFCQRQTGGLRVAAELAGGHEVRVAHVRCAHEGDAFCEWEVRWRQAPSSRQPE
jgi:hypothetical protein